MNKAGKALWFEVPLVALLFLCFFQLLTDFLAGVYAIGLLQTRIPPEIACVALVFAPVVLLCLRTARASLVVLSGESMLLSRVASMGLDTRGQMLAAGLGTAAFFICFPTLLWRLGNEPDRSGGSRLGSALALATLLHLFLRAMNAGNDITGFGGGRYLGGVLAVAAGVLLWAWGRNTTETMAAEPTAAPTADTWRIAGLCVGMVSVLATLYFGLATPAVMARWTNNGYRWITAVTAGSTVLFLALSLGVAGPRLWLSQSTLLGWNLLFLLALGLVLWASRVPFPTDARAYPFPEPPVGLQGRIGLPLMLLLCPVLYVNLARYAGALADVGPAVRTLGGGFTLGSLCLLLLIFAQVFTTVYDYVPVVGPWFRNQFWLVVLAAGVAATLPVLLLRPRPSREEPAGKDAGSAPVIAAGTALALGAIGAVSLTLARPGLPHQHSLRRFMTFNLQQGYSAGGVKNFKGQLELIRQVNPDIVGLQETDTARVAGGNSDLVRFLADGLDYFAHAGPRTGAGTFGIALLSRFPIERARTFYLHSTGEQTAVVEAEILASGTTHHVFVTHLGNDGPLAQQREILDLAAGKTNVVLMGDFNFRPGAEAYRLTSEQLADAWLAASERRADPPHQNLEHRIDHIFVSPGTRVQRAEYLDPEASDHPTMIVEVGNAQ